MAKEQLEQQNSIRQRMAEEEAIREKVDENGNKWANVTPA